MLPEILTHTSVAFKCAFNCSWEITQTNTVAAAMIQVFLTHVEGIKETFKALMSKMSLKCTNIQIGTES